MLVDADCSSHLGFRRFHQHSAGKLCDIGGGFTWKRNTWTVRGVLKASWQPKKSENMVVLWASCLVRPIVLHSHLQTEVKFRSQVPPVLCISALIAEWAPSYHTPTQINVSIRIWKYLPFLIQNNLFQKIVSMPSGFEGQKCLLYFLPAITQSLPNLWSYFSHGIPL